MRYAYTYLALENGTLTTASVGKITFKPDSGDKTAKWRQTSMEELALRGSFNSLALSVVFLSDLGRRRTLRCILVVQAPLEKWFRWQNHHCRSIEDNAAWMEGQVHSGFLKHIGGDMAKVVFGSATRRYDGLLITGLRYRSP